ncbi:MAG: hypothetical protein IPP91_16490 [Betaproteobacteria bacterium]|nr:hypothetical protein [Betaproteobacteria bacterium]
MRLKKMLCDACLAAAIGAIAALLVPGCTATAPRMDWREAVKAGDYKYAFGDLYETWHSGSVDVKAETLRNAWRNPGIVEAARQDAVDNIRLIASSHTGDLASLDRAVKKGPLEDRIEFSKVVNRTLDLDREILAAYQKRGQAKSTRPAEPAQPAATIPPVAKLQPAEKVQPAQSPQPAARVEPTAAAPRAEPIQPAARVEPTTVTPRAEPIQPAQKPRPPETVQPVQGSQPAAKVEPATANALAQKGQPAAKIQLSEKIEPAAKAEKSAVENAPLAGLLAQAAEAKRHAIWRCKGASACDKAMESAQDFVVLNSNMRIQVATNARIETYRPIEIGQLGMTVMKSPRNGDEAELQLTVNCRVGALRKLCPASEARVYAAFPVFMQSAVR